MDTNTLLLVDTSYCCFYRWNALQNWIKFSDKDKEFDENYMFSEDNIFMEKYDKRFWEALLPIMKKFNINNENVLFAIDCPRDKIWRIKYYDEYKINRVQSNENKKEDCKNIFKHTINNLLPKFKKSYGIEYISSDNAEADDIIATIVKHVRNQDKDRKIIIIANDHDYLQLIDDNLEIYSLASDVKKMKLLNDKSIGTGKQNLLYKILLGDTSDNIYSPFKKCGKKTAMNLVNDENKLQQMFEKNPGSLEKFKLNELLIDFNMLPEDVVNNILRKIELIKTLN